MSSALRDSPVVPKRYAVHVDGFGPQHLLASEDALRYLVKRVSEACDMRVLQIQSSFIERDVRPELRREDEGGISVVALISTSHIAIHTWPSVGFFMFDLVSCRPFDAQAVYSRLEEILGMHSINQNYADAAAPVCTPPA
jgi:S-adenosylmethionine/arginine decarboxylase-like enzyme